MTWPELARRLEGRVVVLEPVEARHEEPLWEAAQDPEVWRITSSDVGARLRAELRRQRRAGVVLFDHQVKRA